jgi:hypothetical protein
MILVGHRWFLPIILASWEAEIRRIAVQGQLGQVVHGTPIYKTIRAEMDWRCDCRGGAAQCLLCKCQVVTSTLSPTKINKQIK